MQEITRRRWPTIYGVRIKVNLKWSGPATRQRGQQKLGDLLPAAVAAQPNLRPGAKLAFDLNIELLLH
jgi:hypothetical protein